jgi:hypothetical protein
MIMVSSSGLAQSIIALAVLDNGPSRIRIWFGSAILGGGGGMPMRIATCLRDD